MINLGVNKNQSYEERFDDIHNRIVSKMKRNTLKKNAKELQNILQDIKKVAMAMAEGQTFSAGTIQAEYERWIQETFSVQKNYHNSKFQPYTLFKRSHTTGKLASGADDIFEEDLAALLTAAVQKTTNEIGTITLSNFLKGAESSQVKALSKMVDKKELQDVIKQLAEKEGKRTVAQIKNATAKVDISGESIDLTYTINLPATQQRFLQLMKDATISAKNYGSFSFNPELQKDLNEINLSLGESNLAKAVMGAMGEIRIPFKEQKELFIAGSNKILKGNSTIAKHFYHLRFIYELRGSGLLDDKNNIRPVKYLIYNDPHSEKIFVKDTASLILESLDKIKGKSMFNDIKIAASKIAR